MGFLGLPSREERFWRWFQGNDERIFDFEADRERVFDDLQTAIQRVAEGLVFEFGPIADDGRRDFVVSADGIAERFPAFERLVAAAPAMPRWRVFAFRQPGDPGLVIEFHDYSLTADDVWFTATQGSGRMDMTLFVRGLTPENQRLMSGAVFILMDNVVGEYAATTRVGGINWMSLPGDPEAAGLSPLIELRQALGVRAGHATAAD